MDDIISSAVEEICVQGASGIRIGELWRNLHAIVSSSGFQLSVAVKKVIWGRLLVHPGLQFMSSGSILERKAVCGEFLEDLERIELSIVADEHLRDSFLGLYDLKQAPHYEISHVQRRVLERLAMARNNGIIQSELAKELDIKGTNFFYVVRNLESQQLIVRQSTMVREKEIINMDNGSKGDHIVNTNLLLLWRYAKNLSIKPQQRIEITRQVCHEMLDASGEQSCSALFEGSEDFFKENVCVKDYIPAMKAICERLEAASNKVDVVSGIKSSLGYRKSSGHRAWRAILSRLKYAGLVEELKAEVGGKDVPCLRLLKNFDPKYVQPKTVMHGYDGHETVDMKNGKRGQITDQIVELPLEHCMYDMIDAEGKKGMTTLELSKRLGISSKILHKRVLVLCQRFGVVSQSEIHDKTQVYRFWTHRSKYQDPSYWSSDNCNLLLDECAVSTPSVDLVPHESSFDFGLKNDLLLGDNVYNEKELVSHSARHFAEVVECEREPEAQMQEVSAMDCDVVCNSSGTIESSSSLSVPQTQRYACRMSTGFAARREQRILEKLKNEKFLLKVELHKWLEDVEKDKPSTKDRKTLDRSLKRLQDAGLCKSIIVQIPSLSNFNSLRRREAIFHSSANSSAKLPLEIYERHRSFDIQSRRPGSTNLKPDLPTADITGLRNMKSASVRVVDKSASKMMIENGFVLSKMIRAKLLHKFLWGYLNNSPYWQSALNSSRHGGEDRSNPADDSQFVSLDEAIKEMPLELFLQVAGVKKYIDNLEEKCKLGLRLSDLPVKQYRCFMDTQATARLSSIVYVLYRLRLIQLVNSRSVQDVNLLSYSLELQTYIEEPMLAVLPSSNIKISDDYCKLRHDFLLSDQLSVDRYWETLEYCFAGSDPASSQKCFPGSVVGEVIQRRSWASLRVMTTEQRMELHKRLTCGDQTKKIPFIECVRIARELNITVEQVLRFSYDKRQARFSEYSSYLNSGRSQQCENENNVGAFLQKRRRLSSDNLQDQVKNAAGAGEVIGMTTSASVKPVSDLDSSSGLPKPNYEDASMASFINQCAFDDLKPTHSKRFFWTYNSDRQLIMLYARHRAMLGARFFRVEWPSLSDLPAQPRSCKRRMAYLNRKSNIRKAVLRLCNLLGERYNNYLGSSASKVKSKSIDHNENNHGSEGLMLHETAQNDSASSEGTCKLNSQQYSWDDFEDPDVKMALDDVLKYRRLAKLEDVKRVGARLQKEWLKNRSLDPAKFSSPEPDNTSSAGGVLNNSATEFPNISDRSTQSRSNNNAYHGNFLKFRGKTSVKQISKSLPLANAVELLKLVFLSNSKAVGVQASLAATLQKFSHSDIYAAFNFLREKNFLVVGRGSRPFILSRKFFYNVFSSPFPNDSGKRATNFSSWLQKHQQNLIHGGVAIASDLQCGEMFHLFSLVFSGQLSISPQLPNEGIGEADELKTYESFSSVGGIGDDDVVNNSKRKVDMPSIAENAKRHKPQLKADGDRREKGFPGINVLVNVETVLGSDSFELLKCDRIHGIALENSNVVEEASCFSSLFDNVEEGKLAPKIHLAASSTESSWDALPTYTNLLLPKAAINEIKLSPSNFKSVHSAICQAGEQGLSMDEIVGAVNLQGEEVAEAVVEALIAFRLAIKVNAFDSVRILDASYTSKYFFNVLGHDKVHKEGNGIQSCTRPLSINSFASEGIFRGQHEHVYDSKIDPGASLSGGDNAVSVGLSDNSSGSHVNAQPSGKSVIVQDPRTEKFHAQGNMVSPERNLTAEKAGLVRPIFPWINGDGNTNIIVYRGLSRRIIGFIMQNPGILEEDIINKMDVLNPQSCRRLLDTLVLDNYIMVRKIHQPAGFSSPAILQYHFPWKLTKPALKLRKHYFANPMSTSML